jgi:hypothetical protein
MTIDVGLQEPIEMIVSQLTDDRRCLNPDLGLLAHLHPIKHLGVILATAFQGTVVDLTIKHQLTCSMVDLSKIHHTDHLFGTNDRTKLRCLPGLEEAEAQCPRHKAEDELRLQSIRRMCLRAGARDRLQRAHQDDTLVLIPIRNPRYPLQLHRTQHLYTHQDLGRLILRPTRLVETLQLRFPQLSHRLQPDLVEGMHRLPSLPLDLHLQQEGRLRGHKLDHENRAPLDIPYLLSIAL